MGDRNPRADLGGLGMGGAASGLRVGGGQVGAERDAADVVDTGPAQPVLEVRLLEVVAEAWTAVGAVDRAGVDDGDPLVLQQAGVARDGVEAEDHAGLADDVDELLEDVGHRCVPHRHGEQVVVRGVEALERRRARRAMRWPRRPLGRRRRRSPSWRPRRAGRTRAGCRPRGPSARRRHRVGSRAARRGTSPRWRGTRSAGRGGRRRCAAGWSSAISSFVRSYVRTHIVISKCVRTHKTC